MLLCVFLGLVELVTFPPPESLEDNASTFAAENFYGSHEPVASSSKLFFAATSLVQIATAITVITLTVLILGIQMKEVVGFYEVGFHFPYQYPLTKS